MHGKSESHFTFYPGAGYSDPPRGDRKTFVSRHPPESIRAEAIVSFVREKNFTQSSQRSLPVRAQEDSRAQRKK